MTVSPLTSRIMGRQSSSGSITSSSSGSGANSNSRTTGKARPKSISGYSADMEGSVSTPPDQINLFIRHKRRLNNPEDQEKRRKMNEAQFAAFKARDDITRAGRPYPTIRKSKFSRVIPMGRVDMSTVERVSAKSVEASPFLAPPTEARQHDFATNFGDAYKELFTACAPFYRGSRPKTTFNSETVSEISSDMGSSLSDEGESDDGRQLPVLAISARLDDADALKVKIEKKAVPVPTCNLISCPSSVTIEEALQSCDKPRLMTNSSAPFVIVYANGAFMNFSGMETSHIVGKPLHELFQPENAEKFSLESCAAASANGHDRVITLRSKAGDTCNEGGGAKSNISCSIKVSPIVSKMQNKSSSDIKATLQEVNNVTHFSVDLSRNVGAEHGNINNGGIPNEMNNIIVEPVQSHAIVVG